MMHELAPAFMPPPAELAATKGVAEDWQEVRLWRKVKRAALVERRLAMSAADRTASSEAITATLLQALSSRSGGLIGIYWPFKGEYDPRPLATSMLARGTRFALPVVLEKARPVIFRAWWPGIAMTSGIWNIPIPDAGEPVAPDVLLVPLLGFDKHNYRLGYGGGYYDRTLASIPDRPRTIGVGYENAQIATIFPQPHDIPMDVIVTEARHITRARSDHATVA
jgi:5-formyltetrahydrofolate cyclo-ligase